MVLAKWDITPYDSSSDYSDEATARPFCFANQGEIASTRGSDIRNYFKPFKGLPVGETRRVIRKNPAVISLPPWKKEAHVRDSLTSERVALGLSATIGRGSDRAKDAAEISESSSTSSFSFSTNIKCLLLESSWKRACGW
jgi:hypothetical protein